MLPVELLPLFLPNFLIFGTSMSIVQNRSGSVSAFNWSA
jgi:hypothetical protein